MLGNQREKEVAMYMYLRLFRFCVRTTDPVTGEPNEDYIYFTKSQEARERRRWEILNSPQETEIGPIQVPSKAQPGLDFSWIDVEGEWVHGLNEDY